MIIAGLQLVIAAVAGVSPWGFAGGVVASLLWGLIIFGYGRKSYLRGLGEGWRTGWNARHLLAGLERLEKALGLTKEENR